MKKDRRYYRHPHHIDRNNRPLEEFKKARVGGDGGHAGDAGHAGHGLATTNNAASGDTTRGDSGSPSKGQGQTTTVSKVSVKYALAHHVTRSQKVWPICQVVLETPHPSPMDKMLGQPWCYWYQVEQELAHALGMKRLIERKGCSYDDRTVKLIARRLHSKDDPRPLAHEELPWGILLPHSPILQGEALLIQRLPLWLYRHHMDNLVLPLTCYSCPLTKQEQSIAWRQTAVIDHYNNQPDHPVRAAAASEVSWVSVSTPSQAEPRPTEVTLTMARQLLAWYALIQASRYRDIQERFKRWCHVCGQRGNHIPSQCPLTTIHHQQQQQQPTTTPLRVNVTSTTTTTTMVLPSSRQYQHQPFHQQQQHPKGIPRALLRLATKAEIGTRTTYSLDNRFFVPRLEVTDLTRQTKKQKQTR